jgi:hypothetical protein
MKIMRENKILLKNIVEVKRSNPKRSKHPIKINQKRATDNILFSTLMG